MSDTNGSTRPRLDLERFHARFPDLDDPASKPVPDISSVTQNKFEETRSRLRGALQSGTSIAKISNLSGVYPHEIEGYRDGAAIGFYSVERIAKALDEIMASQPLQALLAPPAGRVLGER
jgi:hypothetical protein